MLRLRTAGWALMLSLAIGWGQPLAVYAHTSNPPDIVFWGPFDAGTPECQRALGDAAQRCFERVLQLQRRCMDAQLAGQTCDTTARDSQIADAQRASVTALNTTCSEMQIEQLHFTNLNEAQADLARACGDQVDAAMSVLYAPALSTGGAASSDSSTRQCMGQTAALGQKLLRFATRLQRNVLDRIALRNPDPQQRQTLLAQTKARIAAAQTRIVALIEQACPGFSSTYGRDMPHFLAGLEPRADCVVGLSYVQSATTCPTPVCGNGVKETGEQCDDGNSVDDDLCHNNCTKNNCSVFPSTFALIQAAIFENHGCTNDLCHGAKYVEAGSKLDLRAGASYASLISVPSTIDPSMNRVEPGDSSRSLLWLKLAAATLGQKGVPGSPMPLGVAALSSNELQAVQLWIHAAAPETGTVGGVAELLDACALPADPIEIQPLAPPAAGTGVQMHMPPWDLPANSENEVCFVTYYDFTNQVPAEFQGPNGTFRFHRQDIVQDPQSHHLIVNLYNGAASIDDPSWGPFTCKGGSLAGQSCDPKVATSCGDGICGSEPTRSVACIGFGPPDAQLGGFSGFTGTQQTSYEQTFATGVYEEVPMKGIIIWNSHAFNLTNKDAKQEGWLNFYFAKKPDDQQHPVSGIFDIAHIFDMQVPAFQTEQVCAPYVLEQGAHLFQLSSHMHKRGKSFTIYGAPCKGGVGNWSPPDGDLMYTSNIYNDPIQLKIDPPLVFDKADDATRTLCYCALYDNGSTNPAAVKMQSTSPPTPLGFPFGGPCTTANGCTAGNPTLVGNPNFNCRGKNSKCDSSPGAGDGVCDACLLTGGVTTEDEMFILLGSYYLP